MSPAGLAKQIYMTHLQEQLEQLKDSLSEMGHLTKNQLRKSMTALFERDKDLANEVIFNEKRVNAFELKIDQDCEAIFALLNPMAHDMRLVFATLKINGDLERIGDYAEGIAKIMLLAKMDFDKKLVEDLSIARMSEVVASMLEDAITSYCDEDTKLARSVFARDLELNDINHEATGIITHFCRENPQKIEPALYLLSIVRRLERVGDHITNISEEVIFFREAIVLKHGNKGGDNTKEMY